MQTGIGTQRFASLSESYLHSENKIQRIIFRARERYIQKITFGKLQRIIENHIQRL